MPQRIARSGRLGKCVAGKIGNSGPGPLPGIRPSERRDQRIRWIRGSQHGVDALSEREQFRVVAISRIAMAKAERPGSSQIPEPDIRKPDPRKSVEQIELLQTGEVTLDRAVRE